MKGEVRSRRRAVRLTSEAHEVLQRALLERWQADRSGGKLTRERRASLLGVSIATAQRILNREGVDRPTLTLAFKSVGLDWDDAYCESSAEQPETVADLVPPIVLPSVSRPAWHWPMIVAVLVMLGFGAGRYAISAAQEETPNWQVRFYREYRLGEAAYNQGKYDLSERHLANSIQLARDNYNASQLSTALVIAGHLAAARGDLDSAKARYQECITLRRILNQPDSLPNLFEVLGEVERRRGRFVEAERDLRLALQGFQRLGDKNGVAVAYRDLGVLAANRGRHQDAFRFFEQCLALCDGPEKIDLVTDVKGHMALEYARRGDFERARGLLSQCMGHWQKRQHPRWIARTQLQMAEIEHAEGNHEDASTLIAEAKSAYATVGDRAGIKECVDLQAKVDTQKHGRV